VKGGEEGITPQTKNTAKGIERESPAKKEGPFGSFSALDSNENGNAALGRGIDEMRRAERGRFSTQVNATTNESWVCVLSGNLRETERGKNKGNNNRKLQPQNKGKVKTNLGKKGSQERSVAESHIAETNPSQGGRFD